MFALVGAAWRCRAPLAILFALCSSLAIAEIRYTVRPMSEAGRVEVTMAIPTQQGPLTLEVPRWAPGSYRLADYHRNIADLKVADSAKRDLTVSKPGDSSWRFDAPSGIVTVRYTAPCPFVAGAMHYSGPATYLYVVGRKEEACRLTVELPAGWKIAVGLDALRGSQTTFSAPDYDVLADNPVTMGDFIELSYRVRGKPHTIALRGEPRAQVDRDYILKVCRSITEAQADFFGGLPYNKYVWHFNVTPGQDGGGGLEHLSSTQISLAAGVGPRSVRVCSHEFFHVWNVKRIRSKPLGPFDYQELPKTGALWFLEGVTDYYADLLLLRYGWSKEPEFYEDLAGNVRGVRSNANRMQVSPHDASYRVGEAANGRGNSQGYQVSYYNTGWLVGLCLDLEIRARTGGKNSLDDVVKALWTQCKDGKPGFAEDEIRKLCVRFGGPTLGEFYDRVVMKPGELPVEEQLAKVGLRLDQRLEWYADPGFDWSAFGRNQTGARVTRVRETASQALNSGDVILAIDGEDCDGGSPGEVNRKTAAAIAKLEAGKPAKLRIRRGEQESEVTVTPVRASRTVWKVEEAAFGDAALQALRRGWFYAEKRA